MITIKIDEETLIDMLVKRVKAWTDDDDILELFEKYYDSMVYGGCYDGCEVDIMSIVDNDYVNNTSIVTREEFEEARDKHIEEEVNRRIEDLAEEDIEDEEENEELIREEVEEDTPTWEDLERGENTIEFLSGEYIEAVTDKLLLTSY